MDKAFIDSLKVNDLVAVRSSGYHGPNYKISKIDEIKTRAGKRTYIVDGCKYDDDGCEKRDKGDVWSHRKTLGPVTDDVRASIKRRREQSEITSFNDWSVLSDDKIARIAAILKE